MLVRLHGYNFLDISRRANVLFLWLLQSLHRENLLMIVQAGKLSDLDRIYISSYWKKGSLN